MLPVCVHINTSVLCVSSCGCFCIPPVLETYIVSAIILVYVTELNTTGLIQGNLYSETSPNGHLP